MDDEDDEMPGMPQHDADIASETDDDAMNSGAEASESSHCHEINGVGGAT